MRTREVLTIVDRAGVKTYTRRIFHPVTEPGGHAVPDYTKYRSMMHHLLLIDQKIRSGHRPNASTLARDLELSVRTVNRKIEFMRDVLEAPIEYDSSRKGYYYSEPNWSLPNIRITEGELLGLAMAGMALHAYKGTPLEGYLKGVAEKIKAALPDEVNVDPEQLADVFRFHPGPVAIIDPKHWELLAKAIREGRAVEMTYYNITKDKTVERAVDPYLLRCYRGDWYLIGRDRTTGYVPMFNLARIRKLNVTTKRFDVDETFNPDDYLGGTFGVIERKERHKMRIRFTGFAARYVPERQWHPSQKLTPKKDGSVVLEMMLADVEEVGRWVLTWGAEAKVLGPRELVEFVRCTAREVNGLYR